jgi:hypothetical protein
VLDDNATFVISLTPINSTDKVIDMQYEEATGKLITATEIWGPQLDWNILVIQRRWVGANGQTQVETISRVGDTPSKLDL